jgi:D-3-phosphoglycerate dehydrogenase / 2-oxoglutarate reductase
MTYKILNTIGQQYTAKAKEILSEIGEVDYLNITQNELLEKISGYDIAIIGLGLEFNKEVLDKAENLKIISTATTGLDHIDLECAKQKGIEVLSLKGETEFLDSITGTAELAFGLTIDLLRLAHPAFVSVKEYEWDREKFRGHNLYGMTLGVVGLGRLGRWMARYGKAFGMRVLACDPNLDGSEFEKSGVEKASFDDLIRQSDVISIHVHLSPETENMFAAKALAQMKESAYLINTSRGKIVNEKDLLAALENKTIAGYGTDILADEIDFIKNGFTKNPLVEYAKTHDNCIIVPHIGGMTYESREATDMFMAEKLKKFIEKK